MNKKEWLEALDNLLKQPRKDSRETMQHNMLNAFEESELEKMELFNDTEHVGYAEELVERAQRFQEQWAYENRNKTAHICLPYFKFQFKDNPQ